MIKENGLARAVEFAAGAGTAQLVIVRGGDIIVDEVWDPGPVDVYAVQKGLVTVMVGKAAELGLLGLDDSMSDHLGAGWTHLPASAEVRVTIAAALDMTTGMDDELRPSGEVGVSWRYDNITYNYLKTVLEIVTGRSLSELSREWLFEPLGMTSTRWVDRPVLRPDGKPITGLESTAHDLARFGAMVLAGGDGVAPSAYLQSLGRPGSDENPAWGLCWWNNDQAHHRLPRRESDSIAGPVTPDAPHDLISARGAMENRLCVIPSLGLVVARTALPVQRGSRPAAFDGPFWRALTASE